MKKEETAFGRIGWHKARDIESRLESNLRVSPEELAQFNKYQKARINPEAEQKRLDYFASLKVQKPKFEYTLPTLLSNVLETYKKKNGVDYDVSNPKVKQYIYLLACYFLNISMEGVQSKGGYIDFDMYSDVSALNFDKGLLLFGSNGTGKTTLMRAFSTVFYGTDRKFRVMSAEAIVEQFEFCEKQLDKRHFFNSMYSNTLMIDDVTKEDQAQNFGKKEIIGEILRGREDRGLLTHMSINANSAEDVIAIMGERYEGAVVSRLYKMFNFVHTDWKDFRK